MFDLLLLFILRASYEIGFGRLDIPCVHIYKRAVTVFSEMYYIDALMIILSIDNVHDIEQV